MEFAVEKAIEILERTPDVLNGMLRDISAEWSSANEGEQTWSPYDIIGHLIHADKTDWIPRAEIILSSNADKTFEPFNRFAQLVESKGKSLNTLLDEFSEGREKNIENLLSKKLKAEDLEKKGIHPAFGEVSLSQLLSAWVVHDLNHIAQISRVMAKQYHTAVGPWREYLGILKR